MDKESAPLLGNAAQPDHDKRQAATQRSVTISDDYALNHVVSSSGEEPVPSWTMYLSILSCVIGTSFSYGYGVGSLNTPQKVMQNAYTNGFNTSDNSSSSTMSSSELTFLWSATVSIYCLGGLVAGSVGGSLADRFGRKRCMMMMNVLHYLAALLMFSSRWTKTYYVIIAGRFIFGFYGGLSTVICPLYLNEIATSELRGKIGTVNQLTVVIALSISQIIGLPQLLGTPELFYYILLLSVIPATIHWVALAFCPESPAWLYMFKKDKEGARQSLEALRDMSKMSSVDSELSDYHKLELEAASAPDVTFKDMFTTYRLRPLMIAAVMHFSQQLCGINAVIFYSTSIFESAHLDLADSQYATLSLGGIMVLMTLVSMALIERLGRRTLHLHGLGGSFVALCLLSACLILEDVPELKWLSYGSIFSVALFIILFAVGPGSIPWFYTAELFDQSSVKWAISIATVVNWSSNFAVGLLYPHLQESIGDYSFFPFMVFSAVFWTYLYLRAPETKGKTTLQLTTYFRSLHSIASLPAEERKQYQTFT